MCVCFVIGHYVQSFQSNCNCLNGDRFNAISRNNGRIIRQVLENRQCLVQAALVQWFDRSLVLHEGQEGALKTGGIHLVYNSLPEPDGDPLHYSSNKDGKQVL
jgi:hypothetical protein